MAEIKNTINVPMERRLFFTKDVNLESCAGLVKSIIEINESDSLLKKQYAIDDMSYKPKPIQIYIDSYGGAVYQCLGVLSVMESSKTEVHTIVTGTAMSCGFLIAICGHKRFAHKYSHIMYHQVSHVLWGEVKGMHESLKQTKKLQKLIEKITLEKTKIKKSMLKDVLNKKQDWYMTSEEALEYGCIDKIL